MDTWDKYIIKDVAVYKGEQVGITTFRGASAKRSKSMSLESYFPVPYYPYFSITTSISSPVPAALPLFTTRPGHSSLSIYRWLIHVVYMDILSYTRCQQALTTHADSFGGLGGGGGGCTTLSMPFTSGYLCVCACVSVCVYVYVNVRVQYDIGSYRGLRCVSMCIIIIFACSMQVSGGSNTVDV